MKQRTTRRVTTMSVAAFLLTSSVVPAADPARHLEGRPGTLVIYETRTGEHLRVNPERAARRYSPCSTFKIPNSLIALQAGAVTPERSTIAWNPERDPRQEGWPKSWSRDHDLTSAIRNSVVWYYQELARRVGAERMSREVSRIGYGNMDTSGGVDRFWLSSSLRISADEQVAFLRRFRAGELGFDEAATRTVKDAIVLERGDGWVWRGKTGACPQEDIGYLGWLVGYVERGEDVAFYALQIEAREFRELFRERIRIMREVLKDLGYL